MSKSAYVPQPFANPSPAPNIIQGPFKTRGFRQPQTPTPSMKTRIMRSLSPLLAPRSYGGQTGLNDLGLLQPHVLVNPATLAFFDFTVMEADYTQMPDNILTDIWRWKLTQNGQPAFNSNNIQIGSQVASWLSSSWLSTLSTPLFDIKFTSYNGTGGPTGAGYDYTDPVLMSYSYNNLANMANARLAVAFAVNQAVPGSTVQIYLSGVVQGTPDYSLDMSTVALNKDGSNSSPFFSSNPKGAQYISRVLTPADNPIIVFTPGPAPAGLGTGQWCPFDVVALAISPQDAYSTTARLGSSLGGASEHTFAGQGSPNVSAMATPRAYKAPGALASYNGQRFLMTDGYVFNTSGIATGLTLLSGDNILYRPQDWLEEPNQGYAWKGIPYSWDAMTGVYSASSGTQVMKYQYNAVPVPGTVLAFQFMNAEVGTHVQVWLNGTMTGPADFDQDVGYNAQVDYTSRALTAQDRPVIVLTSDNDPSQGYYGTYQITPLIPPSSQLAAVDYPPPMIKFNSIMNMISGWVAPNVISTGAGSQIYQPLYIGLTLALGNGIDNSNSGSYLHIGQADYTATNSELNTTAMGNALVAFGLVSGLPTCWIGNKTLSYNIALNSGSFPGAGVHTYGALIEPNFGAGSSVGVRVSFIVDGVVHDQLFMTNTEAAQHLSTSNYTTMFEGIASLPSYGTQLTFTALRLYVEAAGTYRSAEETCIIDYTSASWHSC